MAGATGIRVGPDDPRYVAMSMGFNQRWRGTPAAIDLVQSTDEVVRSVQDAVDRGRRVTVRGGGHCYEDFVAANDGGVIIDLGGMQRVGREPDGTFVLEGGCTNWNVYEQLYKAYDVTLPGGSSPKRNSIR